MQIKLLMLLLKHGNYDKMNDVINIKALNFEVLEVNNETFTGQSTGVITHIPNSNIFNYPLRNYNKAFKYIWDELTVKVREAMEAAPYVVLDHTVLVDIAGADGHYNSYYNNINL